MEQNIIEETLQIKGMTCQSCERRIRKMLAGLPGVLSAKVSYGLGTAHIRYDGGVIGRREIIHAIEGMDYAVARGGDKGKGYGELAGALLILLAVYMVLRHFGVLELWGAFPQAEAGMGYGMLFLIGLLTSVHCVAMCGGINLSQCIPAGTEAAGGRAALWPSALYNLGRVVSYTAVGALVGALGSVISFSGAAKGVVQLAAGVFMVIMGINMLGIFPWLRRITLRLPGSLAGVRDKSAGRGPLIVGLLNGLMPCGPLQAMQIYALSTGSPVQGALSMLLFSLGTVPLMFGLGALSSVLSKRFTGKMVTAGAMLVVVLGVSMLGNGLALSGFATAPAAAGGDRAQTQVADGVQVVNTSLAGGRYAPITVTTGVPVRWTITAEPGTVTGCNYRLFIPEYGIEAQLEVGENIIEFTPTGSGVFPYSCWMGMIRSTITVTDSDGTVDPYAEGAGGEAALGGFSRMGVQGGCCL